MNVPGIVVIAVGTGFCLSRAVPNRLGSSGRKIRVTHVIVSRQSAECRTAIEAAVSVLNQPREITVVVSRISKNQLASPPEVVGAGRALRLAHHSAPNWKQQRSQHGDDRNNHEKLHESEPNPRWHLSPGHRAPVTGTVRGGRWVGERHCVAWFADYPSSAMRVNEKLHCIMQ